MIETPQQSFFDVMIKNSDSGYRELTRLMDRYLLKDILNDTMFELFLAIRKYALPDSIIEIKAADRGDHYVLWTKFEMSMQDLIKFDLEVFKANEMIDQPKEEIIQSRMQEYRKEHPKVLDGFKMVMAYAHTAINYDVQVEDNKAQIRIIMRLPKKTG